MGVAVARESPKRESAGEFPGHGDKKSCAIDGATNKVASGAISAKRNKQSAGWGRGKESPKYERTGEFLERDNRDLAYFPLTAGMRKSLADKKESRQGWRVLLLGAWAAQAVRGDLDSRKGIMVAGAVWWLRGLNAERISQARKRGGILKA